MNETVGKMIGKLVHKKRNTTDFNVQLTVKAKPNKFLWVAENSERLKTKKENKTLKSIAHNGLMHVVEWNIYWS